MTQLHLATPAPEFTHGQTRGACPTLREPMATGDGLLARLRPADGAILPAQLQTIAALAERHGNGQIEITARGNLQVRGLRSETAADFAAGIEAVLQLDTGVPIEVSPLAGLDPGERGDGRPLAGAIRAALAGSAISDRLHPKVTVVLDGGGAWDRSALAADIRVVAMGVDFQWRLVIGERPLGLLYERDVASAVLIVLSMLAAIAGRGRDIDPGAARQRLHGLLLGDVPPAGEAGLSDPVIVNLADGRVAAMVWLPFGTVQSGVLSELAMAARRLGVAEFRLAPHHGLIAICSSGTAAGHFRDQAAAFGLVTAADDPRRTISACIGTEGCGSGLIAARQLAEAAAIADPAFFDGSFALHVSGCTKGCAHPALTLLTLVGSREGTRLVVDAKASGAPAVVLAPDTIPQAVGSLAALWRDNRGLGESVASCFKRLGAAQIAAAARQG